jgi:hypothetical protein
LSHYATIETEIRDEDALVAALEEIEPRWKGKILRYNEAKHLYGYHADERPEVAQVVIPRSAISSVSNDIGFHRDPESGRYRAIISEYDSRTYSSEWLGGLKKIYAKNVIIKQAKKKGLHFVRSEERPDGSLAVILEV